MPTLAGLWPPDALAGVRLLIFGGEACPPELADRLAVRGREVWNTYGPTEATVVACAARLTGAGPVRIGLPLDGWDLAVVGPAGAAGRRGRGRRADHRRRRPGPLPRPGARRREVRRRADPGLGAAPTAAATSCASRPRACCSSGGPTTRSSSAAGGSSWARSTPRCRACPGSPAPPPPCAPPPRRHQILVGYLVPAARRRARPRRRRAALRSQLPAALVPLLAVVDAMPDPHLGQGRPRRPAVAAGADRPTTERRRPAGDGGVAGRAVDPHPRGRGRPARTTTSSTTAAAACRPPSWCRCCARGSPRSPSPTSTRTRGSATWPRRSTSSPRRSRPSGARSARRPRRTQLVQSLLAVLLVAVIGLRWLTWLAALSNVAASTGRAPWAADGVVVVGAARLAAADQPARPDGDHRRWSPGSLLRGLRPGRYPRGGSVHLRLWSAEAVRRSGGGREPRRRAVDRLLRAGARRQGRPGRRPARAAAGHGPAHPRQGLRRSSPRST